MLNRVVKQLEVINIGKISDELSGFVINILNSYEIPLVNCDNIYEATAILSNRVGQYILVVGRIEDFRKEGSRFFDIAIEKGCWCCCLCQTNSVHEYLNILSSFKTGVFLINQSGEFQEVLDKYLALTFDISSFEREASLKDFHKKEYAVTNQEINALLGNFGASDL